MKKFPIITFLLASLQSFAQVHDPVTWNYRCKKVSINAYEVHLSATIQKGWHLYSEIQPENAIGIPTAIKFSKNPLVVFKGKIRETGKLQKVKEPTLGITQNQYSEKVDFVQVVESKIKNAKLKTEIIGTIEFQTCTNKECLPLKTISFSIQLNK